MNKKPFIAAFILLFVLLVGCAQEQPEEYNIEINVGEQYQIDDEIISQYGEIIWSANGNSCALIYNYKIDGLNGYRIKGNKKGEMFFLGYHDGKAVLKYNVTVNDVFLEKIILSDESITISDGDEYNLSYKLIPENASSQSLQCFSSEKDCVNWEFEEGQKIKIKGVNPGETIFTLTDMNNQQIIAECKVTVEQRRVNIDSIEDLRKHLSEIEKNDKNKRAYYEETAYHIPREVFNVYLEKCETPLILTNNAGGYYDNHKNKNLNREIQSNGDIVSSNWTYYGDIAKEERDKEYVDDYYNIQHFQLTKFQLKGNDIYLCTSFQKRVSSLRYVDSRFMIIKEDSAEIDCDGTVINLIIDD